MSKIVVTGGCGFQGAHVALALANRGDEITILNTPSMDATRNARGCLGVGFVWGSVTDPEIVEKTLRGQDAVIHLAAWASVDASFLQPAAALNVNLIGTYRVLDTVRRFHPDMRVVVASSCEVYGDAGGELQDENAPLSPHSPYAASKAGADRLAYAYAKTFGLDVTILRPCNVFGPYQRAGMGGAVLPTMVDAAQSGDPILLTGSGEQAREFMHVDDVVAAYLTVLDRRDLAGEVFNVGTGQRISMRELAEAVSRAFGGVAIESVSGRPGEVAGFALDSSKAHAVLGWRPKVDVIEGLERYLEWRRRDQPQTADR